MLDILSAYTEELSPTKTWGKRSVCWIPADKENPELDRRLGNLTIKLQHAKGGWGRNIELDTYAVVEEPLIGAMGRRFLLLSLTDESQTEPYECIIGPESQCSCKAAKCRVPGYEGTDGCKHRDALRHLIDQGIIEETGSPEVLPDDVYLI